MKSGIPHYLSSLLTTSTPHPLPVRPSMASQLNTTHFSRYHLTNPPCGIFQHHSALPIYPTSPFSFSLVPRSSLCSLPPTSTQSLNHPLHNLPMPNAPVTDMYRKNSRILPPGPIQHIPKPLERLHRNAIRHHPRPLPVLAQWGREARDACIYSLQYISFSK